MTFAISELALRNGWVGICPMPGRGGDYAGDLAVLAGWQPGLLLTMTSDAEMAAKGAATLGADLGARGILWAQLPVQDFTAPTPAVAGSWRGIADQAASILDQGGKVLAHCMGGCGRSGAALLRLMVEAGEAPDAALTRLRAVRPCAVERPEQFAWASVAILGGGNL
jgi:protein-tyrosine phosphatase